MNLNLQHLHNLTTEGWLELFLTTSEKQTFSNHEEHIQDNSITHRLTSPIVQYLAKFYPTLVQDLSLSKFCQSFHK